MTKHRLLSLAAAVLAVISGALYLWRGEAALPLVLPLLAVCFWGICALQYLEMRAAGGRGVIAWLPALAMGLTAAAATFGALAWFATI